MSARRRGKAANANVDVDTTNPDTTDNTADSTDSQENSGPSEEELANQAALEEIQRAQAKAKEEEQHEAPKNGTSENGDTNGVNGDTAAAHEDVSDTPPEGACDVWGEYDGASKYCTKNCPVVDQCRAYTEKKKAKSGASRRTSAGAARERTPRERTGNVSKFNMADLSTQSGQIDLALETPHTMEELMAVTGFSRSRIKSHVKWLQEKRADRCKMIVGSNGKFHFALLTELEKPAE